MSFVARRLGRKEETWLTQIVVNLRLIECQLSVFSPLKARLRDVTHLQMGMKTQPEIDAVFLASFGKTEKLDSPTIMHMLISCEAKQLNQRILEDQIREQVAKSMQITKAMKTPAIDVVKPMAIAVTRHDFAGVKERAIYVVEFEQIDTRQVRSRVARNFGYGRASLLHAAEFRVADGLPDYASDCRSKRLTS